MKVMVDRQYPISVDRLYDVLTSKEFYETRYEWSKVDNYRFGAFENTSRGKLIQLIQPMAINSDSVPAMARRFLPESADLLTEFLWTPPPVEGRYQAEYRFQLGNVPMKIGGVMVLTGDENEAIQHTEVEISSSVPLVGKKLVSLVAPKIDSALASDYRDTLRYVETFC
ncbi:DUF2505 domain-containing protein [Alcanivorax sp.]|jgi:hypothetical protein|uniref:DUF2505 domain-containing protein n=1 Tax=Alcanivorax sp. TaxID=1872427 RepID=UPI0032D941B6